MTARWEVRDDALAQLLEAQEWWRENRSAAPNLLAEEYEAAERVLTELPEAGPPKRHRRIKNLRVFNLARTRYKLYYVYEPERNALVVLAIWSALRGRGPKLRLP